MFVKKFQEKFSEFLRSPLGALNYIARSASKSNTFNENPDPRAL